MEVAQPLRQHPRARPVVSAMRAPEGPRESGLSEVSEGELATRDPGRDARSSSGGKDARFGIVIAVLPRRREVHVHSLPGGEEQDVLPAEDAFVIASRRHASLPRVLHMCWVRRIEANGHTVRHGLQLL